MRKKIITLSIGFLVVLAIIEILLRAFPSRYTDFNSSLQYITEKYLEDDDIGRLRPNQVASWNNECFRIFPIKTNSLGFRDREWNQHGGFKIAVLGSSDMEAISVPEAENTADILEKLTEVETLNFGASGYNTINKLLAYKKYARTFSPKLVLLFFHFEDLNENSCNQRGNTASSYRQCALLENGQIKVITPRPRTPLGNSFFKKIMIKLRSFVSKYCRLCVFIKRLEKYHVFGGFPEPSRQTKKPLRVNFKTDKKNSPDEGRFLFEFFLKQLNIEVEKDGAELVVINFSGSQEKMLEEITFKNNIRLLNLEKDFLKYRDTFDLKAPYFSYRCASLWNPLGHFLAASVVSRYLIKNKLVPVKNKSFILTKIEENLSRSPKEILGEKAYQEIYGGGIFKGKTNIKNIIRQ